jgi:hypothetical protein
MNNNMMRCHHRIRHFVDNDIFQTFTDNLFHG